MDDAPASAPRPATADTVRSDPDDGVRLPAASLRRLSRLCGELGTAGIAAVRDAGRAAGRSLVEGLPAGEGAGEMELDRFWTELADAAESAGFGRVEYRVLESDVGEVELRGSPESRSGDGDGPGPEIGCHFAAGWIGGALSAAAGEPVGVLEVRCAAAGDAGACRFLVGPESRLQEVRTALRAGAGSLREALEDR